MFPPKKKKLGESVGFGGRDEPSAPPRYKAGGDGSDSGGGVASTRSALAPDTSVENDAQEKPADEQAFHSGGGSPVATPESVNYRTSAETCGHCEYMQGSQCSFLQQPVEASDSCNRFEDKGEDMGGGEGGEGGESGGGAGAMGGVDSDNAAGGY